MGRINKKPIVDTPTARKLYVQACRRIWHDIQSVHTSEQWVDLVVSYGMEMSNGWSAFRKNKNVTITFKRMVEEYFDEFVDADGNEMFARAFEAYVESALLDQKHRNDYLVCDTYTFVYPLEKQREHLNRSIKSLMEVAIPYIINSIQGVGKDEL